MQGRLRNEPLSFHISTECGHCGEPLHLEIDHQLNYRVQEDGAKPLVFVPMTGKIKDKSIIDAF